MKFILKLLCILAAAAAVCLAVAAYMDSKGLSVRDYIEVGPSENLS